MVGPDAPTHGFLVVLEVVGVPRHHHANAVRAQEIARHELLVVVGHVVAARKERMAEHRHHHLAARRLEGAKPRELLDVNPAQHTGVDRDERERRCLQLKERRVLRAGSAPYCRRRKSAR